MKILIFLCVVAAKDESLRKIMKEIEYLTDDSNKLQQILDVIMTMRWVWSGNAELNSDHCFNDLFFELQMSTSTIGGKYTRFAKRYSAATDRSTNERFTIVHIGTAD